jgi:peroxiredoxin
MINMKKLLFFALIVSPLFLSAVDGYQVGSIASDFELKNVDGKMVSMADYPDSKGFVIVFTCNHCPYAVAYQERIIEIDKKYKSKGYPVIAINPNDPEIVPGDSFEAMKIRSEEKGYTFPYLFDAKQEVYKAYGATRTPHIFLLQKNAGGEPVVKYIGAIDDNFQDPAAVQQRYLQNALDNLLAGVQPDPSFTKAIGCTIKAK